jgi:hypothetical protein
MNNIIYFESTYLKGQYLAKWKSKAPLFHYEVEAKERIASAIASQYFQLAVFIFDDFTQEKQKMILDLLPWRQDIPFFIIANYYSATENIEDVEFQAENRIFYFKPEDLKDMPGIMLRVLKQKTYYRRKDNRAKTVQKAELKLGDKLLDVTIKDLSASGARVELRRYPKNLGDKFATLIHTKQNGIQVKIPVELRWANVGSDGRLHLGTAFQRNI